MRWLKGNKVMKPRTLLRFHLFTLQIVWFRLSIQFFIGRKGLVQPNQSTKADHTKKKNLLEIPKEFFLLLFLVSFYFILK